MEQTPESEAVAVLITRGELKEWIEQELEEYTDAQVPESTIETLVEKLEQHFSNDIGQWIADNLNSFFDRDDVQGMIS